MGWDNLDLNMYSFREFERAIENLGGKGWHLIESRVSKEPFRTNMKPGMKDRNGNKITQKADATPDQLFNDIYSGKDKASRFEFLLTRVTKK